MALEELIVAWAKERPPWQREVMRRVATGEVLSDDDYDNLVADILAAKVSENSQFGLKQLPQPKEDDLPVSLVSIQKTEHVNALESKVPLIFEPKGLTIVYGDNGSGKSGYARLLKRITRARHREEVLTDVFRDTSLMKPTALLSVRIGDTDKSLAWPTESPAELQRVLFYDAACGNAYIAEESDFPYRPSALYVMDALIEACLAVRTRIDAKLGINAAEAQVLPPVPEQARFTDAGKFLISLSSTSSLETLDRLISDFDQSTETIEELKNEEARLRAADTTKLRQQLLRQSEKLAALQTHIENLARVFGTAALAELQQRQVDLKALNDAATVLARSFDSEPLPGVGNSPWKVLWEAAQRFSKDHAYPQESFPFLGAECRCVLCQQLLDADARDRLGRFEGFIRDDTQVRLQQARRVYDSLAKTARDVAVSPDVVTSDLKDLESSHREIVDDARALLRSYETAHEQLEQTISAQRQIPHFEIEQETIVTRIAQASSGAKAAADELGSPEGIQKQLQIVAARRADLELLQQTKASRAAIVKEVTRLKERDALEVAKTAAATTGITKKILELSEQSITEVVRDTFTRETDRLRLERVTIARTRADRGALLHRPKLVGARQQVTLPRVFSEGERTALGLASFFTEAHLDASKSALILDDPVTSLDHVRRGLVAARLVALAETRQVVVFTHDISFVADLKREANGKAVPIGERSVARSRGDERKPGSCSTAHPWKAKDVAARLDELRKELARLKKESINWDQKAYEDAVAVWAGNLSETWERIFSQEIVGAILAEGGLEVRPMMVKVLARFSEQDQTEFETSYSRVSQWAKRHDKSALVNYVAPEVADLEAELDRVGAWFKRVKGVQDMIEGLEPYAEYKLAGLPWLETVPAHWQMMPNRALMCDQRQVVGDAARAYTLLSLTLRGVIARDMENPKGKFPAEFNTYKVVRPNDFVFCLFDVDETPRGVGLSPLNGMITGAYDVFSPTLRINPRFLYYYYLFVDDRKLMKPLYTGLRKTIQRGVFASLKAPCPLPDEQAAIVRFLDHANRKIDGFIRAKRKLIALLGEQKQAIIHRAVTRGLNPNAPLKPSGIPWLGDIPKHWEIRRMKKVGKTKIGLTYSPADVTGENGCLVLRASNIKNGKLVHADDVLVQKEIPSDVRVKTGDILICARSGSRSLVGKSALITAEFDGVAFGAFMSVFRSPWNDFVFWVLNSNLFNFVMAEFETSTINQLTQGNLNNLVIPVPPRQEQFQIVKFIEEQTSSLNTAIARTEREIALMQEYRTRLTAEVVTGKLDVREAAQRLPSGGDETISESQDFDAGEPAAEVEEVEDALS